MQYEKLFRTQSVWKSIFHWPFFSNYYFGYDSLHMTDMFFMGQLGDTRQVAAVPWWSAFFLSAAVRLCSSVAVC